MWNRPERSCLQRRITELTHPRHGPRLNRRVPICSQYDGGLAHARPVPRGVVLLRGGPELVAGRACGLFPRGRVEGHWCASQSGCRRRRRRAFKRPVFFVGVRLSRFTVRGAKSFAFVAGRLGRRVVVVSVVVVVVGAGGRRARSRAVRLVGRETRGSLLLLRRDVAGGRLLGHRVPLLEWVLEHERDRSAARGATWRLEACSCEGGCSPFPSWDFLFFSPSHPTSLSKHFNLSSVSIGVRVTAWLAVCWREEERGVLIWFPPVLAFCKIL